jgi:cytochrome P450
MFSSRDPGPIPRDEHRAMLPFACAPVEVDPPLHTWTRRLLLPWFSNTRVAEFEKITRPLCRELAAKAVASGRLDANHDFAQQIPVRVTSHILGVDEENIDQFCEWVKALVSGMNEPEVYNSAVLGIITFFGQAISERRDNPGDDLVSWLLQSEDDKGAPINPDIVNGMLLFVLGAGIDTTWSAISSSLWHLATHPEDRRRLVAEPELLPTAIEEFLRAYSPVATARIANQDTEISGCPIPAESRVIMSIAAANRDPAIFPDADKVLIDRKINKHIAFASGIHRCAGSNLARMELRVALEEFLAAAPEFELEEGADVQWTTGVTWGPKSIPVVIR